ncbi:MAG: response regulator, partial [Anaerolineae bacterium]|nr:response regulator [Anaerolineae bacterium]
TWEAVDVSKLLDDLCSVVEPLARAQGVPIHITPLRHLTVLHADRVMLRQAILNVITYALDTMQSGAIKVSSFANDREMGVHVLARRGTNAERPVTARQRRGVGLDIGQRLMSAMGGALRLAEGIDRWEAWLAWPVTPPRVLLVIDDNEGFVDLFRRYLAGYPWQVIGAADGAAARRVIAETRPAVIVLDVMMPQEDGWDFLSSLKSDEHTRDIPVIVCSVLNEPRLAQALGAESYLPKPVTQQALLQALAPWS